MREVRFRAWDRVNKRMLRVVTMSSGWMEGCNGWFITGEYTTDEILTIDPQYGPALIVKQYKLDIINHELMQFTGIHDKNGKEIWEGDIVRYQNRYGGPPISFKVVFDRGSFLQTKETSLYSPDIWYGWDEVEVIGNIYENPELLEVL